MRTIWQQRAQGAAISEYLGPTRRGRGGECERKGEHWSRPPVRAAEGRVGRSGPLPRGSWRSRAHCEGPGPALVRRPAPAQKNHVTPAWGFLILAASSRAVPAWTVARTEPEVCLCPGHGGGHSNDEIAAKEASLERLLSIHVIDLQTAPFAVPPSGRESRYLAQVSTRSSARSLSRDRSCFGNEGGVKIAAGKRSSPASHASLRNRRRVAVTRICSCLSARWWATTAAGYVMFHACRSARG